MRIVWDLRLFSYGYATRGVGVFVARLLQNVLKEKPDTYEIFIWGNKNAVPAFLQEYNLKWIHYRGNGNWKNDLVIIPILVKTYSIDLFHYWIALGPLYGIGMGAWHNCKVCLTIHDLGTEYWTELQGAAARKKSWFWHVQKKLVRNDMYMVCNSFETKQQICRLFPRTKNKPAVLYVPAAESKAGKACRNNDFFTLGGAAHKNVRNVVEAFRLLHAAHESSRLIILGDINKSDELPEEIPSGVYFESIDNLENHLYSSAGLVVCSFHEGLGIPVIDALAAGCPLVVSDIAVFHETCGDAGRYVDPNNPQMIAQGMKDILNDTDAWKEKITKRYQWYRDLCLQSSENLLSLYSRVLDTTR